MPYDPTSLESELRKLRAAPLDASLLERLEDCVSDTMTALDAHELSFERQLQNFAPAALPPAVFAALESKLSAIRFPAQGNIVEFPLKETAAPSRNRGWWGAAAAVALTGALAALLVPPHKPDSVLTDNHPHPPVPGPTYADSPFVPAGYNRGLSEASDQGVIWGSNNQAQRVLKVVYMERSTFKDANGRTCEVEQPRVEYILVPAKTD